MHPLSIITIFVNGNTVIFVLRSVDRLVERKIVNHGRAETVGRMGIMAALIERQNAGSSANNRATDG